jgi:site-specific recombinase XerD
MISSPGTTFKQDYQTFLQHMELKGLQPKTVEVYSRGVRRIAEYFDHQINDLTEPQLLDYFTQLRKTHSWSAIKHDLYGIKFYHQYVLHKCWAHIDLIKPPKTKKLPNIVSVEEASKIFMATNVLSYRVFFFTVYSLGLRISEGLRLEVGDIDSQRMRVHIRNAKGNKDRFVPLPNATLDTLKRFWLVHRNPLLLFPNRKGGLQSSGSATTHLDKAGAQIAMRQVIKSCGIKKRLPSTACVTAMQPI